MFESAVPAGAKVPALHYDEQVDEAVYGLEVVLSFTVDGWATQAGPGDCCFVRRAAVH